jgi:photosystem II stability/assembly factor-like uncharacterized protein
MKKVVVILLTILMLFSLFQGVLRENVVKADNGCSWSAVNTGLTNMWVQSLAIDPKNTNTVYAGTHDGAFKSTNGGINWAQINNGLTNLRVNCLVIDSQYTNTIYAGTDEGIFKTIDGGQNWMLSSNGLKTAVVFPPYPSTYSLAIDHQYTNTIYAGTDEGIFKTIDGGQNWTWLNGNNSEIGAYQPFPGPYIWSLAIDSNDSNIIYATVGAEDRGVYKSTNSGQKWIWINNSAVIGYFVDFIIIDPSNSNTIYAGGFKSTDGGLNWTQIGLTDVTVSSLVIDLTNTNIIYAGTKKGVFKSTDGGLNWTQIGLTDVTVSSLVIDPTNTNIIYAGTDNSGVFKYTSQCTIILHIGNKNFTVNEVIKTLDSPPVIKNSRTLLPIRAVIEALGGTVGWDATERKVTVSLGSTTIELWIGKSVAKVNGIDTPIDPTNPKVVPEIINSRTMLPLRFVTENLGAVVDWEPNTQTITYQP